MSRLPRMFQTYLWFGVDGENPDQIRLLAGKAFTDGVRLHPDDKAVFDRIFDSWSRMSHDEKLASSLNPSAYAKAMSDYMSSQM